MSFTEEQQEIGRATQKTKAFQRFEDEPIRFCEDCGKPIPKTSLSGTKGPIARYRKRRFCSKGCASRNRLSMASNPPIAICQECGERFPLVHNRNGGGYIQRKLCDQCWDLARPIRTLADKTLGDILQHYNGDKRKLASWIRTSGHLGRKAVMPTKYEVPRCNYSLHLERCHIRGVSDFPLTATVREVNVSENIVHLCPNHHWEFDHGHLYFVPKDCRVAKQVRIIS